MDADDEEELLQSMYDDAFSCTRTGEERRWQVRAGEAAVFPSLGAQPERRGRLTEDCGYADRS